MKLPLKVDLTGKTAIVTGGGGILCSMFSEALALCGAKISVWDLNVEAAEKVAVKIRENGGEAMSCKCNVLQKESIQAALAETTEKFGPCSILINGAGGNNPRGTIDDEQYDANNPNLASIRTFFKLDLDGFKFVNELNLLGTLMPTQVITEQMVANGGGSVVNMSSMSAFAPLTKVLGYDTAKAAVSNLTMWLAVYFAKSGIRVNALAPGFFVTHQNRDLLFTPDGQPTGRTKKILHKTPMDRFGEPEELIGGLLYLVSDEAASFVSGVVLPIDGGFMAYSGV
jgi:NAD(P)-dependent dehydrogenase (short-subunit alcohol dehydrogenase family)